MDVSFLAIIDSLDDLVDNLTVEEEDYLLIRDRIKMQSEIIPRPPMPCSFCNNWIDIDELYYIIGGIQRIICLECSRSIFDMEDLTEDEDYYD